ncbi:MAG TPA: 4-alpha-glucanotransferase [bacterium]|nr:4-alpha-glucanotransferase [bacterium]
MKTAVTTGRRAGILLHITSLPSDFGIGDLGPAAREFADFLAASGQVLWQILPLSPTSPAHGNSPYSSSSAYAGNPLLISPERMADDGLLSPREARAARRPFRVRVDYEEVGAFRRELLSRAASRIAAVGLEKELTRFQSRSPWLPDYALFRAIGDRRRGQPWWRWPRPLRERDPAALERARRDLASEIDLIAAVQFLFHRQWKAFHEDCAKRGISLIGDIPIYVDRNSADVWSRRDIFQFGDGSRPRAVSGVPPDYFTRNGQLWGNPLYDWPALARDNYSWWVERMRHVFTLFDYVRLDHFRGFEAYWAVPAGARTARGGRWEKGPGFDLFRALKAELGHLPVIAEDLGEITPPVRTLMKRCGFPGMKVIQFAFETDLPGNEHAPHNYRPDCVVYTGTHDNNTARGWYEHETSTAKRRRIRLYLGPATDKESIAREMVRLAYGSVADLAIVPFQDILGLGAASRMNTPGSARGNWEWRFRPSRLNAALAAELSEWTWAFGRRGTGTGHA